jgi:hypothetical protein
MTIIQTLGRLRQEDCEAFVLVSRSKKEEGDELSLVFFGFSEKPQSCS